jgi:hypothetical protein
MSSCGQPNTLTSKPLTKLASEQPLTERLAVVCVFVCGASSCVCLCVCGKRGKNEYTSRQHDTKASVCFCLLRVLECDYGH